MFRALLFLAAFALPFFGESKIIETAHIADVVPLIDQDTWFLVDIDNTLYQADQWHGHADWFYEELKQKVENGVDREEAIKEIYPFWLEYQETLRVKTLEEDFIPSLYSMQNQGIVVMGLTHRQPRSAEITSRQVASLDLDFSKTAPYGVAFSIPTEKPSEYVNGILFAGDFNKKKTIFQHFLDKINQKPKKIVFIDDKRKNVEELEEFSQQHGIEYIGVHYTAIESCRTTPSSK